MEDISELKDCVEEVSTDFKTWKTVFKCKICGQMWIEQYENKGHGEVPSVFKCTDGTSPV